MDTETVQSEPVEASETPEPLQPLAAKKPRPRSEAQLKALQAARARALEVRKANAEVRVKERAVQNAQKVQRMASVEEAYDRLPTKTEDPDWDTPIEQWPDDPPLPVKQPKPKRRKPARRIVVTEVSSESEDEEDVEVLLPKYKPPPAPSKEELHMQKAMDRMFNYGL